MITKEDLNEKMLTSYLYNLNAIGKDETWGEVAMNMKPLESWEKYQGFNLFRNASFIAQVNQKMKGYNNLTADMVLEKQQIDYETLTADIANLKSSIRELFTERTDVKILNNNMEKIDAMRKYLNEAKPKIDALLARKEVDVSELLKKVDALEEKINIMWSQYQRNTNNQMAMIEFERRLALLESKMEENGNE